MNDIHLIERKLQEINDARFQELCDDILYHEEQEWQMVAKLGSVLGRDKTRKGTPDTFFMHDGRYVFVEYSTNLSGKYAKLAGDLEKCLDTSITKVDLADIERIILCFNFKLSTQEVQQLKNKVPDNIHLDFRSIDWLTEKLAYKHKDIASAYLQIPIGSNQITTVDEFVKRYGKANAKVGTPLDNPLICRKAEITSIYEAISTL